MPVRSWNEGETAHRSTASKRRLALFVALGVLIVANVVLVGILLTQEDEDPTPTTSEVAADTIDPGPTFTPEPVTEPEPTVEPEPSTATAVPEPKPAAAPAATATSEPPAPEFPPLETFPERVAIYRAPKLYLEGAVPDQETIDRVLALAGDVVGPDNVVNNYVIHPDAPIAVDGTVRVEQAVLFQTGSAAIAEDFTSVLNLGVAVMALNPQVTMVVEGHTDSDGSDEANLVLSIERAEAAVEYLVEAGVARNRLVATGFGEGAPIAANDTAAGRQLNRRIEVQLLDLLSPNQS